MLRERRSLLVLVLAQLLFSLPAMAQEPRTDQFSGVREFIRKAMEENDLPSVAVAVAKDGRIIWEKGFGWADLDRRIPATEQTMYSLASISKPMTATALMRLVEQGRVELDRPANHYLGEGKIHSRAWDPADATVRRVLSHTAGLPLHWEFFYEGEDHPRRTTDEGVARFGVLAFPPGELFQYSNLGYGIIERIIERVSGRDYGEFMEAEVFEPLNMNRSIVTTGAGLGDSVAVRYDSKDRPIPHYDFDHRGGSAVYSSASDLVRFGMYHLGHRARGQKRILSDSTLKAMQRLATPGTGPREQGYGLGWLILKDDNGYRRISHTGGMPGVSTLLNLYPEEDLAVVVLTNRSAGVVGRIAHEIVSAVLPQYGATARERREATIADAAPVSKFSPTPALLGSWSGTVFTPEDTVPLTLVFQPDGDVHARLGDGLVTLVNDVSFNGGQLVGRFAGTIPAEDTGRHPHIVLLNLRLRGQSLSGAVTAHTPGEPAYFALSSYGELRRQDESQ